MFTSIYKREQSGLFLSCFRSLVPLHAPHPPPPPPPPVHAALLSPSSRRSSVSLALQVVALLLAVRSVTVAGKRMPVFVHTPTETPSSAFGGTALKQTTNKTTG